MSRRCGRCTIWCLTLLTCLCGASCGRRPAPDEESAVEDEGGEQSLPATKRHPVAELRVAAGPYLIPQDAGRLSVACPKGWEQASDRSSAKLGFLLGFQRKGSTLEDLPRILIAAADSPFPECQQVQEATLGEFVQAVRRTRKDNVLATPVTPVITGNTACAAYVEMVKRRAGPGPRLVVMTVAGGRLYTINLDVPESQFKKFRDAAYAVAASLKAVGQGDAPPAEQPPAEQPPSEPAPANAPVPPAEKAPATVPAESGSP